MTGLTGATTGERARLLRDHPAFRRYWLARLVSVVGDGAAEIALLLYAAGLPNGPRSVGLVLLAASVPRFFAPFLGAIADRYDRRTVLICADIGQAIVYGVIALTLPSMPGLLALVAVSAVFAATFGAGARAAVPTLVEPAHWVRANALLGLASNLQVVLGPAIGGLLTGLVGTRGALSFNAASFLVSAVLLAGAPRLPVGTRSAGMRGYLVDVRAGLAYALRHRTIRAMALLMFAGVAFGALDNVALVFLARGPLHAGPIGYGILAAAFGVGMLAGSLGVLRVANRINPPIAVIAAWTLLGAGLIATGLAPFIVIGVATQACTGIGNGVGNIAEETLLQRSTAPEYLGRVGSLLGMSATLGGALAYGAGGFLVDAFSPRTVFVLGGSGVLIVIALVQRAVRKSVGQPDS